MKILAISTWFPYPPDNGAKQRAYNLLSYLGARHTLDLLTTSQNEHEAKLTDNLMNFCRRVMVFPPARFVPSDINTVAGFFTFKPRCMVARNCEELLTEARIWAAGEQYDAVIAETLEAAAYCLDLDVPVKLLDEHNIESHVLKRQAQDIQSIFRRARYTATWMKTQVYEATTAMKFDRVAVVSEMDKQRIKEIIGAENESKVSVIPNGADPSLLDYPEQIREPQTIIHTGSINYRPNYDAARTLCFEILPRVQFNFPNVRVLITGAHDKVNPLDLMAVPGVEFTGYVSDIRPILGSATVLATPLRFGGGTRLKVLEAMALGTPVVSTPMGAEGLDVRDGVDILMRETPREMADQICRVLADSDLRAGLSRSAKSLVRSRYLWPEIGAKLEEVLVDALDKRRLENFDMRLSA
jgi:glycosyltransferase involved in cell wall biosynthesis